MYSILHKLMQKHRPLLPELWVHFLLSVTFYQSKEFMKNSTKFRSWQATPSLEHTLKWAVSCWIKSMLYYRARDLVPSAAQTMPHLYTPYLIISNFHCELSVFFWWKAKLLNIWEQSSLNFIFMSQRLDTKIDQKNMIVLCVILVIIKLTFFIDSNWPQLTIDFFTYELHWKTWRNEWNRSQWSFKFQIGAFIVKSANDDFTWTKKCL